MAESDGVVEEILVRLDVEDVVRCKSVCKSWYSLISTPYFVKAHNGDHKRRHGGHYRITNETESWDCQMIGSSNGLVCIVPARRALKFIVTNPFSREVRELETLPENYDNISRWGFGYDSLAEDYKVVVGVDKVGYYIRFLVLTLKSNIWKFIGDVNYISCGYRGRGTLHNGALDWVMLNPKNYMKKVIVCFDLSVEKFKEINLPHYPKADRTWINDSLSRFMLGVFEDSVCVLWRAPCNTHSLVWAMKNDKCSRISVRGNIRKSMIT